MNFLRRLAFQLWYFQNPPWDTGISPPELVEFIHSCPAGRALDLGCGTGTNAMTLWRAGWDVTGVDFAWEAIRRARRKARQEKLNIQFQVGDVTQLTGIGGPFDLILDIGCYHSLPGEARRGYQNTLGRLLAPNGTFLLYTFIKSAPEGPGVTEAEIDELAAQFPLVSRQAGVDRGRASAWLQFRRSNL